MLKKEGLLIITKRKIMDINFETIAREIANEMRQQVQKRVVEILKHELLMEKEIITITKPISKRNSELSYEGVEKPQYDPDMFKKRKTEKLPWSGEMRRKLVELGRTMNYPELVAWGKEHNINVTDKKIYNSVYKKQMQIQKNYPHLISRLEQ